MRTKLKTNNKTAMTLLLVSAMLIFCAAIPIFATDIGMKAYATGNEYTIVYNAGTGTGGEYSKTYEDGEGITIAWPANLEILPQNGYHFTGWNTISDGSGTAYAAGVSHTVTADLTLYAQWSNTDATPFTARLYDNANYAVSTYTELTEGGAVGNGWDYNYPTRYLVIEANFTGKNGGTISITLPTGMALYGSNYSKMSGHPNMANEPSFITYDENPGISGYQQGTANYSNALTGTLIYTFLSAATNESLTIPVTFDQTVWDRSTGLANLSGDKPSITIVMTPGSGLPCTKTLSKVLSSKGNGPFIYPSYWPTKVPINIDRVCMSYSSVRNADTYYRSLTMEYILPHDQQGNYAEYVGESTSTDKVLNGYALSRTQAHEINTDDPTKLVYTWTDYKQSGFIYLAPALTFPDTKFHDGEYLTFTVRLTGVTYSGAVITDTLNCNTQATVPKSEVSASVSDKSIYFTDEFDDNVYSFLGGLSIKNTGLADSDRVSVTINFDTSSANAAGTGNHSLEVAVFSLPQVKLASNVTFDVACTLVNANNDDSISYIMQNLHKTSATNLGYLLIASDVVAAYNDANPDNTVTGDWYLKTLSYEVPKIPTGITLYNVTAQNAFSDIVPSGGNYYGRILNSATCSIDIKEWNETTEAWGSVKSATSTTTKTNTKLVTLYVGDVSFSGSTASQTITAGDSITMNVPLRSFDYPYGTSQFSLNPVFYFVAPVGVSIPAGSVSAIWSDGSQNSITTVLTSRLLSSGNTAYKVEFDGTASFGGPVIVGSVFNSPNNIRYPIITFTINTAAGMDASSLLLKNNLFVSEDGGSVVVNETYHTADTYDLDEDLSTTDNVGRIVSNTVTITITPNTNQLEFSAQAKMSDEPDASYRNGITAADRLYLSDTEEMVNYRLTIKNNSGSIVPAGNFIYYIPIPKSSLAGHHMLRVVPGFDLELVSAVSITGSNPSIYDVRYSIDATALNYNNGKADFSVEAGQAGWLTAAQVTDWSEVTMIKIIGIDIINGYIPTDTADMFTMSLSYSDDVLVNVGKENSWGCCGVQKYKIDGTFNADGIHTPTPFVTVMLRSEENHSVTLTAASGMLPTLSEAVRSAQIELPDYVLEETIGILSVKTENVVLQPSATIILNGDSATGAIANSSFGITVQLDDKSACELSAGAGYTLGTTAAGVGSSLTLVLYNYDALSDIITPRRVTLVLGDNNGIQITVVISIARERATVNNVSVHIESGKDYQIMHGSSAEVTITQDSAFTAQFVRTYVPINYSAHTLTLLLDNSQINFPEGTKLTLINLTNPSSPGYFYFKFEVAAATVTLTSFVSMFDGITPYNDPAAGDGSGQIENETLLLITDFSGAGEPLDADSYTLLLSLSGEAGIPDYDIDMMLTLAAERNFLLSATTSAAPTYNTVTVTGTASTSEGSASDSRWLYRKMALVVTLKDVENNTVPFPNGIIISMDSLNFIPSGEKVILPLGSLGEYDYSYTIATPHTQITAGTYTISTALYVSSTASAENPMGGDLIVTENLTVTVRQKPVYALSVDASDGNRLIERSDDGDTIALNLNLRYNENTANAAVTLEIQEKVGNTYLTSNVIIVSAAAGGNNYIVNGYGVIQLPTRDYGTGLLGVTLTLNKRELTVGNTYRICAKAVGSGDAVEDVFNFVVIK